MHKSINLLKSWYLLLGLVALLVLIVSAGTDVGASRQIGEAEGITGQSEQYGFHKVIAPPGVLDADNPGVSLWHDYGSFALYRVSDASLDNFPPGIRKKVSLIDGQDSILIDGFESQLHDLDQQNQNPPRAANPQPAGNPRLQVIQFVGPIKDEWLQAVKAAGATPVQYIANHGYLVWADDATGAALNDMAARNNILQFQAPYPALVKIGPALSEQSDPQAILPVVIQMYRHKYSHESEAIISDLAVEEFSEWSPVLEFQTIRVTLRAADVEVISQLPDVYWIEEEQERQKLDEVQGQILAANFDGVQSGPSGPGYLAWLNSHGFSTNPNDYPIVDITDDGIGNGSVNSGDATLRQFGSLANPTRLAYVDNCTAAADGGGTDGHGHLNVSIAGGYDSRPGFPFQDPLGFQRGLGINPYGRIAGTRVFGPKFDLSACGGDDSGLIKRSQDNGARISSNSWGCTTAGCMSTYDVSSQAYDAGTRDADATEPGNQEMIFLFSAGNRGPSTGTIGTPGNGKNMITVGASENDRPSDEGGSWFDGCNIFPWAADDAMDIISFSSRGPAPGGRVKPELIAPGTHVQGTASTNSGYSGAQVCDKYRPTSQTIFAASSGTSHSAPAVAGVASLAYRWMQDTYGITPSPAMMKAYLMAHPTYLTGINANDTLPSNRQGYGMPNMSLLFESTNRLLVDQLTTFDNSGETWTWTGKVNDPARPVRVALAYTDAPGAVGATSPQVNDLNLSAEIDGTSYLGNVFSGQWSTNGGSADPVNNYEAIFRPAGTGGPIKITVTAFNIAGDGVPSSGDSTDQDFAIVCYNCRPGPVIDVNPDKLLAGLDVDLQSARSLEIKNPGSESLNWNLTEDDTACDSPTDIPWLNVSPTEGTITAQDSTAVDVSFDSTGLALGFYSANLCISSNDTVTPLLQIPVSMLVAPPRAWFPIFYNAGNP